VREIADCVKGIVAEPMFEYVDANDLIEKVMKPLKIVGNKRRVIVKHEPGRIPKTMIDQKQLYNAVYNLVNNAIPETPSGGSVTVRTYGREDGEFPDGRFIMIEVADTGKGIPAHVRERLFTEDAVSTKPGGTGLGTKIVKNVVDAHRGRIAVESEEGKGTRFFMRIPVCDTAPPKDASLLD
jgi:signal transduction histidine kinase